MKSCVYILQFNKSGRFYVGSTTDLNRRIKQHLAGHTKSTNIENGFSLVFSQEVDSIKIARYAEKRIKSWKRRDYTEKIIIDGKIKFLEEIKRICSDAERYPSG